MYRQLYLLSWNVFWMCVQAQTREFFILFNFNVKILNPEMLGLIPQ
jgi:hypothetical protein